MSVVTDAFASALTAAGFDAWAATYGSTSAFLANDPVAHRAMLVSQFLGSHPEAMSSLEASFVALVAERPELSFRLDAARAMAKQHAGAPLWPFVARAAPAVAFGQEAIEVAPVKGVQTWAMRDSTQPLATLQAQRANDVAAFRAGRVAAGYTTGGQVIDIDDAGRADLTSMMTSANASLITVLAGTAAWPSNYATGWVSRSGGLLPLPKATDGIKLATAALNFYSALIQREAALKKAVSAAASLSALRAIDITAGWPAST